MTGFSFFGRTIPLNQICVSIMITKAAQRRWQLKPAVDHE